MAKAALEVEADLVIDTDLVETNNLRGSDCGPVTRDNSKCIKNSKKNTDEFYVIGHLFDQCDELISLDDVLGYIAPASGSTEQESTHAHKSLSFFKRLTSGNMITSGKKKCTNIVMSIAGGSQYIGQSSIQKVYHQESVVSELPPTIVEACKLSLKCLRDYNNGLIQEKWLAETSHLLQNETLTIGVFGRHKAGKSTVLNALLHQEILPSAVTNETAFITSIHHEPCLHQTNTCSEDCERFLSIMKTDVKGRRNVRNTIRKKNLDIRDNKQSPMEGEAVTAHVPFLCKCSTGKIRIVLLDTPGLAESNELGTSELSEHQLMTCSAFIYVISCLQLEDAIDTDTLRAIAERDPCVFSEKRMLIVVTRLDEYKKSEQKCNDDSIHNPDSDDEETASLEELVTSIKKKVQQQCKDFVTIPDDCIIPVSATGALEARKVKLGVKSRDIKMLILKFERLQDKITTEKLDKISQVPLLEEKLFEVALNSYRLWHYSIVRDCSRYLEHAVRELVGVEAAFKCAEEEYLKKVNEKERLKVQYKEQKKDLLSKYDNGSIFHGSLERSYDEDVQSLYCKIDEQYKEKFQSFQSKIKEASKITSEDYKTEVEKFIEEANESLKIELKHVPFKEMNAIIKESTFDLGVARLAMEQTLAEYCNTTASASRSSFLSGGESVTDILNDEPVSTAPLELKDLLTKSNSLQYSIFDRMVIFAQKVFLRLKTEHDPRRRLLDVERNALLDELKQCLMNDSKEYFNKIKPKIVESYLLEHRTIAERHLADVKSLFLEKRKQIDNEVKDWKKQVLVFRELKKSQSILSQRLTEQKSHLTTLYAARFL